MDRINHKATVALLLLFAVVCSTGQYINDPIHCWCPAFFTDVFVKYTNNYCWIANTYHIPMTSRIPANLEARRDNPIVYYQWVPFILLTQALLFKLPYFAWHMVSKKSGIDMTKLCNMIDSVQFQKPEKRDLQVVNIARYIHRWLLDRQIHHTSFSGRIKQQLSRILVICFGQRHGHFLTGYYMYIKLLYCINGVTQFFILNGFLAIDYWLYGFEKLSCMFRDCPIVVESKVFPRVTLCDFEIRQLDNLHIYTVQCILPFNMINEKMFTIIWFWMFAVAILNVCFFLGTIYHFIVKHNREVYVRKYLRATNEIETRADKHLAKRFANHFLRNDGCFVLRVVSTNTTDMFLSDVIKALWLLYKEGQDKESEGLPEVQRLKSVGDEFEQGFANNHNDGVSQHTDRY